MPNIISSLLSKAQFKTPRYSAFPQSNEVKFSGKLGLRYPVQRWIMNPGDSIDVKLQQLTRFAPLAAPLMHHFTVDFQAIEIPDRLAVPNPSTTYTHGSIDGGFENFHNLDVNDVDRPTMPQVTFAQYCKWLSANSIVPIGTLLDFLGYPTFSDLYRITSGFSIVGGSIDYTSATAKMNSLDNLTDSFDFRYQGYDIVDVEIYDFVSFLIRKRWYDGHAWDADIPTIASFASSHNIVIPSPGATVTIDSSIFIDALLQELNLTSVEAVNLWKDYVFSICFSTWIDIITTSGDDINNSPISLLPLYDYWTAVYDWYINTNITKPASKREFLYSKGLRLIPSGADEGHWLDRATSVTITPALALWNDDYFTSSFDVAANGGSIAIPAGTLQNLREASALDKLRIKLQYAGKRYIDQILAIFGVHSSNERLDRCRVLGVAHFGQQVEDILQTSQSTLESSLGDFAGKSISVGQNRSFIHYTAEEHSTIMVFMTVRPVAVYEQIMPKDLFKVSPYDYLIPGLEKVGEQSINPLEIYPNISADVDSVFGFQRRYAEYMYTPSHIHGEFRTSLDYWHAAREFDSVPALNEQFVTVNEELDNLDRIFAVPGAKEHIYSFLYFDTVISRPLPKYVNYGF